MTVIRKVGKPVNETKKEELKEEKTVKELQEQAKKKGIEGYSSMNKQELIDALVGE